MPTGFVGDNKRTKNKNKNKTYTFIRVYAVIIFIFNCCRAAGSSRENAARGRNLSDSSFNEHARINTNVEIRRERHNNDRRVDKQTTFTRIMERARYVFFCCPFKDI